MKKNLIYVTLFFFILILFYSCKKDGTPKGLDPYYKLFVNGSLKTIDACGSSDFVASYLKDTAVHAAFSCGSKGAGFFLNGKILDGTYVLDNKNIAFYDEGTASYHTDSLNKGTLTIKSGILPLSGGGPIPIIEGTFSFDGIEKNTGQKIKVTSGKYLLKKYQY